MFGFDFDRVSASIHGSGVVISRSLRSLGLLASITLVGSGLAGCNQLQQTVSRFRQQIQPTPAAGDSPSPGAPRIPYLYIGNSNKGTSQDVNACAANVRSILASNGYVDSVDDSRNNDGSAVWVSADRNDIGVSAKFQCSNNGVTVLAMSGMENDKVFAEYDRIHGLNW